MKKVDSEALSRLRHSASHVMAQAVLKLFPGTKLAIGPAIKDGFYYDFEREEPFTDEDLRAIEAEMRKTIQEGQEFRQTYVSREEAAKLFQEKNQPYKLEILAGIVDEKISLVQNGPFIDLCEGGHAGNTREIKAFHLLNVAGAYWRGNEHNKMLQRIYGTAFFSQDELDAYLLQLEEAKKRDHRKLGKQLDLFSFHLEAPGMPFYHPKGLKLYENLIRFWREEHSKEGYLEVKTPVMLKDELWKQSGHYEHYQENMFFSHVDDGDYAVKPMNCPGGILIFKNTQRSYRELPMKMAELGLVHRRERSGVLHGLFRVNAFTIDDAHIFCLEEQIEEEISKCIALILKIYKTFGFNEISISLSTRPKDSMGSDEIWEKATAGLKAALTKNHIDYFLNEGGGAFYGPKIDFEITDSIGREWQCGTIQLDFQMPERFKLGYIASDNSERRPVMVHRAAFGSIERFLGILIEHYAGAFPLWLAPVQVRILAIAERHGEYARSLAERFQSAGFRVETDWGPDKVGYKIRSAEMMKIPYIFVVGDKEVESQKAAVRKHGGKDLGAMEIGPLIAQLETEVREKQ